MARVRQLIVVAFLGLELVSGCADESSREALIEAAAIAIDNTDYATAVTILEGLCPDVTRCSDNVLALLAQARMGLAGVDLVNLITVLESVPVGGSNLGFTTLDAMFGPPPDGGVTDDDVTRLEGAILALKNVNAPTAADYLDMALSAGAHLVASVMRAADSNNDGIWDALGITELNALAGVVEADLVLLETSMAAVEASLGGGTTLTDSIGRLRADINGGTGVVTGVDLGAYIVTL